MCAAATRRIHDYFRGVVAGFDAISSGHPIYPLGVYGSGCTCSWLKTRTQEVKYAWLAQAPDWCGYDSFTDWNLKQGGGATLCELDVDLDESTGDGGGFQVLI